MRCLHSGIKQKGRMAAVPLHSLIRFLRAYFDGAAGRGAEGASGGGAGTPDLVL